jgi:hypothetical protein
MKFYLPLAAFFLFPCGASTKNGSQVTPTDYSDTRGAVSRLLSLPTYTAADEKILNRSGDLAAIAIMRAVSVDQIDSPKTAHQILLILSLAFATPQLIADPVNRTPTASILLLDRLEHSQGSSNAVGNVRREVEHNSSTGHPFEVVTLAGEPPVDLEHMQWVASVLQSISDIKPGMTRKDLLTVFTTEGGLSTPTRRTFVLKGCPGIKVDVEFSVSNEPDVLLQGRPDDKIVKISRPYLAYSIID